MMKRKGLICLAICVLVCLGIVSLLLFKEKFSRKLNMVCYDEKEQIIYSYGNDRILLENVINPFWTEEYILGIYDDGEKTFIGKYSLNGEKWEELLPSSLLYESMNKEMDADSIYNIRIKSDGTLTFIYDGKIYSYDSDERKIELVDTTTEVHKFEWMDENTLFILSEWEKLQIGKLEKYNLLTGDREFLNDSVADFACLQEENRILYSKKYFMGSWTEYELYSTDVASLENIRKKRYRTISVGNILGNSGNEVYVIESELSLNDKLAVYYINEDNLIPIYVTKMQGNCIGIFNEP